jgi:protein-tyrosine phosphatase
LEVGILCAVGRSREVEVDGLVNVRDLGGRERQNGLMTPRGVFFRSENVDGVTQDGWEQLRELGITTVVDLRQERERRQDGSRRPDWLTIRAVDLDGWENQSFWKDYWDNGLVGTALYYTPHLKAMPERTGAVLSAIISAPPGGVLFHCMGGRDRTGMIAMLLLRAIGTRPEEIVDDYLQTVRRGEIRAARAGRPNDEPALDAFCRDRDTTTEKAFRDALAALELEDLLDRSGISTADRLALRSWRGTVPLPATPPD